MKPLLLSLALFAALSSGSFAYRPSSPRAFAHPVALVPPSVLWGVAMAESSLDPRAVSPDGRDRGLFQLRRDYDEARGVLDPFNPVEALGHAQRILAADYLALGSWDAAVTAYRHGRAGFRAHGVDRGYLARVWRGR